MQIDHTYYPHILDQIIAHAPPASLLRLSHCSRALRERITPLLYGHVTLRAAPRNRGQVHAPAWPFQPLRILQGWRDEEPHLLSKTHVLDLCAAYFYGRAHAFPNLKVIRHALAYRTWPMPRFPPHDFPRRVHLVKHKDGGPGLQSVRPGEGGPIETVEATRAARDKPEEQESWLPPHKWESVSEGIYVAYLHVTEPRWHEEHDVPGLFIDPPEGTRRLVLHLSWDPSYPRVRFADITLGELAMFSDVVIVFEPSRKVNGEEVGHAASSPTSSSRGGGKTTTSSTRPLSNPDTYYDPMRDGMFGNLCYTLMNQVLDNGVAVWFVGVEQCTPAELFLVPPESSTHALDTDTSTGRASSTTEEGQAPYRDDLHGTVSAAWAKLRDVVSSVLLMPEDYGWDCYPAWESMSANQGDTFSGLLRDGLAKHFRFETLAEWRQGGCWEADGGESGWLAELRRLESTSIGWEEHEERIMRSSTSERTRTFTRRP